MIEVTNCIWVMIHILFRFHTSVKQLLPDSEMGKENMRRNKQICWCRK